MNLDRRRFLLAASSIPALLLGSKACEAQFAIFQVNGLSIGHGWNTLPLGAGGLVTGLHIANDGTMVCRTDVGNIYRWSGLTTDYADATKVWQPLLTLASLAGFGPSGGQPSIDIGNDFGAWEHVLAPGNSSVHAAIFTDMANVQNKSWLWYSTNSGATWNQSNLSFLNATASSNLGPGGNTRRCYYKIAIDPANPNVAYCGIPYDASNVRPGAFTSLNKSGGSTLATWASVKTSGSTPVGNTGSGTISCGIVIDSSLGTTTIGGQTVTKHIYLPVGGVDIYESFDGGNTFVSTGAATAFSGANFLVTNAGCNTDGVYYAIVIFPSSATSNSVWRYIPGASAGSGTWTNITPSSYTGGNLATGHSLIVDSRNTSNKAYLSVTGPNGLGAGFTATSPNTGTPSWNGLTGSEFPTLSAASYDIPYLNYIFGQQSASAFTDAACTVVDPNGVLWFGGNQSLWYNGTSNSITTPNASLINYGSLPSGVNSFWWSMGRGQEATVGVDVMVPPGGTYPILGPQDIGAPLRGTFTNYPQNLGIHFQEFQLPAIEYAASDSSFVVATITYQSQGGGGAHYSYSPNYGADGTWTQINAMPDSLWNSGGTIDTEGGQVVAVDHDTWLACPMGFAGSFVPAFTRNASSTASWSLVSGLSSAPWLTPNLQSWVNGNTAKAFCVGYGTDLGCVWAVLFNQTSTATLYRCPDLRAGSTFTSIGTFTTSVDCIAPFIYAVPGFPNELWISGKFSGSSPVGLWHVTNANTSSATITLVATPIANPNPVAFSLGAPSSGGGYPTIYYLGNNGFGTANTLYQGTTSGSGSSMTVAWATFGPTGTKTDLPLNGQVTGIKFIRADPNVYQRLYAVVGQSGYVYYNP